MVISTVYIYELNIQPTFYCSDDKHAIILSIQYLAMSIIDIE